MEEYILSAVLLIFFQENCNLNKASDFKELFLHSYTQVKRFLHECSSANEKNSSVQAQQKVNPKVDFALPVFCV